MLKRVVIAALLIAAVSDLSAADKLRIMSYNVRNCIGMDSKRGFDRVADVISSYQPDIVAVQEIDSVTNRSEGKDVLFELCERTGMRGVYSAAISYDGGKYGIGILCKEKPVSVKRVPLPGREEQRTAIIAEFKDYVFIASHLSLTSEDRKESFKILLNEAAKFKKPVFMAGDFNAVPDSEEIKYLAEKAIILSDTSIATCPADNPTECIDYICVIDSKNKVTKLSASVIPEPVASDHRPVFVGVTF